MSAADGIRIIMDLERLGELIGAVCVKFAEVHGYDAPEFGSEEMRAVAISGMEHCYHMADRAQFAASVQLDLAMLDALSVREEPKEPAHRPEFGFFDPPV